jgi:hypothetical protein
MVDQKKLVRLRELITESLRVQRGGGELIDSAKLFYCMLHPNNSGQISDRST